MTTDQVFISYAHKDEVYVRELARDLAAAGLAPWHFTESQRAGVSWPLRLRDVLVQSRAVVVVVSPHSNRAEARYVIAEVIHAQQEQRFIVPLCTQPCSGPLDVLLAGLNWVLAWNEADPARKVADAIRGQSRYPASLGDPTFARLAVTERFRTFARRPSYEIEPPRNLALLELPATTALCTLGRHPRAELSFTDTLEFVGRVHARIHAHLDGAGLSFLISDEDSRNGTFVNGAAIAGPHPLLHGDQIGLGTARPMLLFEHLPPTGAAPSDSWLDRLPDGT